MSVVTQKAKPSMVFPGPVTALLRSPLAVWGALFVNVLAFSQMPTLVPIPPPIGQMITQGSLILAVFLALLANPRGVFRPSFFLVLLTILGIVSLMVSLHNEFMLGSIYRSCRLVCFVLVLWLLSAWWGRSDFTLLRAHLTCLRVVIISVIAGVLVAPGAAFSYGGRLSGALWPIPPTQVGHYAAVLLGCTVVLWFGGAIAGRTVAWTLVGAGAVLVGAHTRTALLGILIGLGVAGASMFLGHARVRRTSLVVGLAAVTVATVFAPFIVTWISRGQTMEDISQLTGRTKVWSELVTIQRPRLEEIFGSGLSNQTFKGLSIDNSWLADYLDQGWFGIVVDATLLLILVLLAITHRRGVRRATALFLVAYSIVASITETGLGDASPYTLDLVIAASLLAAPMRRGHTPVIAALDDANASLSLRTRSPRFRS